MSEEQKPEERKWSPDMSPAEETRFINDAVNQAVSDLTNDPKSILNINGGGSNE